MSKSRNQNSGAKVPAPAATQPPHLHKKIEELELPEVFEAISHIAIDVFSGRVGVVKGRNGNDASEVKRTYRALVDAAASQSSQECVRLMCTICEALQHDRIEYISEDRAARGRAIHLRDLKGRLKLLVKNAGKKAAGSVDVHPAIGAGSTV